MRDIIIGVSVFIITAVLSYMTHKLSEKKKKKDLSNEVDVWLMRTRLKEIKDRCADKGRRTEEDTQAFYEGFAIYTGKDKMNKNSYICRDVEPAFKEIKRA